MKRPSIVQFIPHRIHRPTAVFDDITDFVVFAVVITALTVAESLTVAERKAPVASFKLARLPRPTIHAGFRGRIRIGLDRVGWYGRHLHGRTAHVCYRVGWYGRHLRGRAVHVCYRVLWLFWHVRDAVRVRWITFAQHIGLRVEARSGRLP
jgi:hypothetical protein